ncbi:MAG: hypothetical protein RI930_217 [Pseudomonadota bacterium]|jgi:hypothetical protein
MGKIFNAIKAICISCKKPESIEGEYYCPCCMAKEKIREDWAKMKREERVEASMHMMEKKLPFVGQVRVLFNGERSRKV